MTNHVHLIVVPQEETSLAGALKRTNQLYAQYVNHMHRRRGHFWQDRFFSCPSAPTLSSPNSKPLSAVACGLCLAAGPPNSSRTLTLLRTPDRKRGPNHENHIQSNPNCTLLQPIHQPPSPNIL